MLKQTPLREKHLELSAKMVDFAGFEMPIQYTSIIEEHMAVRTKAGIFDVSHMGEILVKGEKAEEFLNGLLTNNLSRIKDGKVQYTIMTYEDGGTVDDLMVYRLSQEEYLLVVNAANKDKDYEHIKSRAKPGIIVQDVSEDYGLIAVQGPKSAEFVKDVLGDFSIPMFNFKTVDFQGNSLIVSRTGYTGENGFEVYGSPQIIKDLFSKFIELGVVPCGLGARDTLRFEAGLPLYGNELGPDITPIEGGLSPFIDLDKSFLGRDVLKKQKEEGLGRRIIGLKLIERGVPRQGYPVYYEDKLVGHVTSGNFAPYLKEYLALALVKQEDVKEGKNPFEIEIRGKRRKAEKVSKNFLKNLNKE